jgi:hypothetical protein
MRSKYTLGTFIPRCLADGSFALVQCTASHFCWCVDYEGQEISRTRTKGWPACGKKGLFWNNSWINVTQFEKAPPQAHYERMLLFVTISDNKHCLHMGWFQWHSKCDVIWTNSTLRKCHHFYRRCHNKTNSRTMLNFIIFICINWFFLDTNIFIFDFFSRKPFNRKTAFLVPQRIQSHTC